MRTIGMSERDVRTVIRLLSAILWLGNLTFHEAQADKAEISYMDGTWWIDMFAQRNVGSLRYDRLFATTGFVAAIVCSHHSFHGDRKRWPWQLLQYPAE